MPDRAPAVNVEYTPPASGAGLGYYRITDSNGARLGEGAGTEGEAETAARRAVENSGFSVGRIFRHRR